MADSTYLNKCNERERDKLRKQPKQGEPLAEPFGGRLDVAARTSYEPDDGKLSEEVLENLRGSTDQRITGGRSLF